MADGDPLDIDGVEAVPAADWPAGERSRQNAKCIWLVIIVGYPNGVRSERHQRACGEEGVAQAWAAHYAAKVQKQLAGDLPGVYRHQHSDHEAAKRRDRTRAPYILIRKMELTAEPPRGRAANAPLRLDWMADG